MRRPIGPALALLLMFGGAAQGQGTAPGAQAKPLFPAPRVPLAFNRLYDYPQLVEALQSLVKGHPDILSLRSLGKSVEGRDLWCLTINNPKTGSDRTKPAMYVDGNVHGNEIQGAEAALYVAWYLAENRDKNPRIGQLVDSRAFYIVPTINPDGRAFWFNGPNTTHSSRSGKSPRDDDRDGVADEDGFDDLNSDGQITQMRRRNPHGTWKPSPEDPRVLVPIQQGENVRPEDRFDNLGNEGIDNDGDGRINEDPPGGYDMNRNWPADWQPDYIQFGAGDYPLSWPETRAVALFLQDHPNVAGVQSFHNAGGMILRGPGHPSRSGEYAARDERTAAEIGRVGERMIPFYRSMVIHKDLYSVHGGFVTWTYEHLGIVSFTNELWNESQLLGKSGDSANAGRPRSGDLTDEMFASDRLLLGSDFVPWTKVNHPLYGAIEVGGFVKQSQRVPPPFMIEELCHRNAAFVMYHAEQMPVVAWDGVKVERLSDELSSVTVAVRNQRLIPTVTEQAGRRKIGLPDVLSLEGAGLTVVGGGTLVDVDAGTVRAAERNPAALRLESGVAGEGVERVRWFVRGTGDAVIRYRSQKAGNLETRVNIPASR